jgi:hypothetical protein
MFGWFKRPKEPGINIIWAGCGYESLVLVVRQIALSRELGHVETFRTSGDGHRLLEINGVEL